LIKAWLGGLGCHGHKEWLEGKRTLVARTSSTVAGLQGQDVIRCGRLICMVEHHPVKVAKGSQGGTAGAGCGLDGVLHCWFRIWLFLGTVILDGGMKLHTFQ
jgi:hypothetical protein